MFRINVLALAGAVLVSSASIVAVSPVLAADTATAKVSFGDLDLGSDAGRAMLDHRILTAASTVCTATNGRVVDQVSACTHKSVVDAHKAVDQAAPGVTTVAFN